MKATNFQDVLNRRSANAHAFSEICRGVMFLSIAAVAGTIVVGLL
jgi:hypothetical protein